MSGEYVLFFVLAMLAMGGVEWPVRLLALAGAITLLIGGMLLLRRTLGRERWAEAVAKQRPFARRDWPYYALWWLGILLVNLLGREWAGRFPLLVLGGALAAVPSIAVLWWQMTHRSDD